MLLFSASTNFGIQASKSLYYLTLSYLFVIHSNQKKAFEIIQTIKLDVNRQLLFSEDIELGIQYFEDFLLDRYSPKKLPLTEQTAALLKADTTIPAVEEADRLGMNRKTFTRQFKKHVGCTATEFKRITRFKKTARKFSMETMKAGRNFVTTTAITTPLIFTSKYGRQHVLNPKHFLKILKE